MKRATQSLWGRARAAALLRSLSVLIRHHPMVAAEVFTAGAAQAGRVGVSEAKWKVVSSSAAVKRWSKRTLKRLA